MLLFEYLAQQRVNIRSTPVSWCKTIIRYFKENSTYFCRNPIRKSWNYPIQSRLLTSQTCQPNPIQNKHQVLPNANHEAIWGSGSIAPLILNSVTIWRLVVSFTSGSAYRRGKYTQYPWKRRLCRIQCQCGGFREDKILLLLPGIESRL
jgi:hypothetical protein